MNMQDEMMKVLAHYSLNECIAGESHPFVEPKVLVKHFQIKAVRQQTYYDLERRGLIEIEHDFLDEGGRVFIDALILTAKGVDWLVREGLIPAEYGHFLNRQYKPPVGVWPNNDLAALKAWVAQHWQPVHVIYQQKTQVVTGAATTSRIVRKLCYTQAEADAAYIEINNLVTAGKLSRRSAAAYKSHISRRIAP